MIDIEKEKKRKEEMFYSLYQVGLHYNEFFYFLFHDLRRNTVHAISKLQTTKGRYDGDEE